MLIMIMKMIVMNTDDGDIYNDDDHDVMKGMSMMMMMMMMMVKSEDNVHDHDDDYVLVMMVMVLMLMTMMMRVCGVMCDVVVVVKVTFERT